MGPDFDDLVGTHLDPVERERLERVHDLLVAAGPPPDFVPVAAAEVVELRPRRRRGALVAIAAALAVALFALGAAAVQNGGDTFVVSMAGTTAAPSASASIHVFQLDSAGNWPMEVSVGGLKPAGNGRPFELWLTRRGKRHSLCGSFLTNAAGSAVVPMNAPYHFDEYDGWVVVEKGSDTPLLTT
jgi:hypothetical protein